MTDTRKPSRRTAPDRTPRRSARTPRARWAGQWALLVVGLVAVWVGITLGPILVEPGADSLPARVAGWARGQGLGWAVTGAEQAAYEVTKPQEGGELDGGIPEVGDGQGKVDGGVRPLVSPALEGEGQWQPLLESGGRTVGSAAFVRPDAQHTSFSVGIVRLDPSLRFVLHPGSQLPGRVPGQSNQLTAAEKKHVLATFNSGFRFEDSQGGYWQAGQEVVPLVEGAASMVIDTRGRLTVRAWPGGPVPQDVAAVRQNLVLLVDHGKATAQVDDPRTSAWGKTVGNAAYVWRSAVGVQPDGSVIVVVGPAMTVRTLTDVLLAAGVQTAMELDINKDWTSFITYAQPGARPTRLTPDQVPQANRYLQPSTRDFVAVLP